VEKAEHNTALLRGDVGTSAEQQRAMYWAVRDPQSEYYGPKQFVCPRCQVKGRVTTRHIKSKKGVSGKATAALLTGGVSMLAVGLSRKQGETAAKCGNCRSEWTF
jgi:hypothetical protein